MGTGWAVGSAATLGLAAVFGMMAYGGALEAPAFSFPLFFALAAYGCWAYAISRAAYGSKGALAALLAYDLVAGLGLCGVSWARLEGHGSETKRTRRTRSTGSGERVHRGFSVSASGVRAGDPTTFHPPPLGNANIPSVRLDGFTVRRTRNRRFQRRWAWVGLTLNKVRIGPGSGVRCRRPTRVSAGHRSASARSAAASWIVTAGEKRATSRTRMARLVGRWRREGNAASSRGRMGAWAREELAAIMVTARVAPVASLFRSS